MPPLSLPRSSALRATLKVATGSSAGQAITLAVVPVLARLYTPGDFGVFAVVLALTVVLAAVAPLRFEAAIPLPGARQDGVAILWVACGTCTAILLPLAVILFVWQEWIAKTLGLGAEVASYLWVAPLSAILLGSFQSLNQLAIRDKRFSATARRPFYSAVVTGVSQVALAGWLSGAQGLLLGYTLGVFASAASLVPGSKLGQVAGNWGRLVKRYRRFPLLLAPSALLNALSLQLPIILIASLYGQTESGFFGMTQRAVGLPIVVVATAVGQVYLGEMSDVVRHGGASALHLFDRASSALATVGLALLVVLVIGGPALFGWVLGSEWQASGRYAQIVAPAIAAQMLTSPLAATLIVLERQLTLVVLDSARVVGTTGALVAAAGLGAPSEGAVAAYSAVSAMTYMLYWLKSRHALKAATQSVA